MNNTIFIKKYNENMLPPVNDKEVWRYAGFKGKANDISGELANELRGVKKDLEGKLSLTVCYEFAGPYPLSVKSTALEKFLKNSEKTVIFASTIGFETDRYISRMQKISPLKALLANALGSERIEALCDVFCEEIRQELLKDGLYLTNRFSPGYGDLPLPAQKELFQLLDITHKTGISLNDSLLMSPSKSVTAIMGVKTQNCVTENADKCESCDNKNCQFRKQENI